MAVGLRGSMDLRGDPWSRLLVNRDRLAPVGIGAVGRIEPVCPLGQRGQLLAGLLERCDVLIEVIEVVCEQSRDMFACRGALFSKLEDGSNLCEREPRRLRVADESEALNCVLVIDAVAVGCSVRLGKDADLLVVSNCLGGHAGLTG